MDENSTRIAALNDAFRRTGVGGREQLTAGILARGPGFAAAAVAGVRGFAAFTPDNDPYGEHDFGAFDLQGSRVCFKIDYYDLAMEHGSENPADPSQTTRVLTVMLAEEY